MRQSVAIEAADSLWCDADPALLRIVLTNLFQNAVEHAPRGGAIACTVFARPAGCQIEVVNHGPALTDEDVPHLFERFWRKDPARGQDDGAGLGLSLSRALATAMGMQLIAELAGGTPTLRLTAPIAVPRSGGDPGQSSDGALTRVFRSKGGLA
jgi:signal transduction histidine kinase